MQLSVGGRKHCKDKRSNLRSPNLIGATWAIRDDSDDVMETSLTIDYDKQWLNPKFKTLATVVLLGFLLRHINQQEIRQRNKCVSAVFTAKKLIISVKAVFQ